MIGFAMFGGLMLVIIVAFGLWGVFKFIFEPRLNKQDVNSDD